MPVCGVLLAAALAAAPAAAAPPVLSIIIDDLGDQRAAGARVLALPGPVACAILPATPHGAPQARACKAGGKEVLLHFPLQPLAGRAHPLAVTTRSTREELGARLRSGLGELLPHVDGVNIHQGSLLSQRPDFMHWLMAELRQRGGLYFVDSYTSGRSVAYAVAESWRLPAARRQIFLDAERGPAAVQAQFQRLIALARRDGAALAIGHPFPETLALLETELPRLASYGVELVAPSVLIERQQRGRTRQPSLPAPRLRLATALAPWPTATVPRPPIQH